MNKRKKTSTNYNNQVFLENRCSLNELLNLVSRRWITDVLFCIEDGSIRYKNIKEDLEFISDTVLADRLRLLTRYGLITKTSYKETPPRVEYSLTESGKKLSELLDMLCKFGENSMQLCSSSITIK
ncbi:helix-turn-helix domain-containing protein [Lutibacter sp. B1]|uniref:winged helix-turn-helix transcriptional regulator n=1 Tax=Lutibacter sp. B1 TaxID=2725996 RepID=UPI001456B5C1|nr:helix-turn-helix domain-containing protein [Lutibacter sp. B1]NLP58310.1 helix-turn-helix transcriptional regulator [Lutibacter sp. B1]